MTEAERKKELEKRGFYFDFHRDTWVNRKLKKVLTLEFVEDVEDELFRIALERKESQIGFYFSKGATIEEKHKVIPEWPEEYNL